MINIIFYAFIALSLLFSAPSSGADNLSIGRMNIKIWPEYDDPGVLVIYDGRFSDATVFPAEAGFLIPKGSVVSDACSVSPRGEHFCQLYTVSAYDGFDRITLTLPYPNFYLSFHTPPLEGAGRKSFTYTIKTLYPVDTMEVDIQQPLRAREFTVSPPGEPTLRNGFTHLVYQIEALKGGESIKFNISYFKEDAKPSVDIKYSPPMMRSGTQQTGSPYSTQRLVRIFIYAGFVTGLLLLGMITVWFIRSKKAS